MSRKTFNFNLDRFARTCLLLMGVATSTSRAAFCIILRTGLCTSLSLFLSSSVSIHYIAAHVKLFASRGPSCYIFWALRGRFYLPWLKSPPSHAQTARLNLNLGWFAAALGAGARGPSCATLGCAARAFARLPVKDLSPASENRRGNYESYELHRI